MADDKLTTKDGKELPGYLNASAGPGKPAIILIHEWWGLNAQIRSVADRYAKEGFNVFAADLYHGKLATDPHSAQQLMAALDWGEAMQDLGQAVQALKARFGGNVKLGITGFCMGGAVTLAAASNLGDFAAAVPYYGIPPQADVTKIKAKVQGHYANIDDWCTPDRVNTLEAQLKKAGIQAELFRYDAQHAFANENRPEVYSAKDAQTAWGRTVDFFKRTLA